MCGKESLTYRSSYNGNYVRLSREQSGFNSRRPSFIFGLISVALERPFFAGHDLRVLRLFENFGRCTHLSDVLERALRPLQAGRDEYSRPEGQHS